jgi:hypothetical protein
VTVGHYYSGEFRCWLIAAAIDSITMLDIANRLDAAVVLMAVPERGR